MCKLSFLSPPDSPPYATDVEPQWVEDVELFLRANGYTQQAQREVIDHAREFGSVECCISVNEEHRPFVEFLLPVAPPAAWRSCDGVRDGCLPKNTVWVWNVTDPDACLGDADCDCSRCRTEAADVARVGAQTLVGLAATL